MGQYNRASLVRHFGSNNLKAYYTQLAEPLTIIPDESGNGFHLSIKNTALKTRGILPRGFAVRSGVGNTTFSNSHYFWRNGSSNIGLDNGNQSQAYIFSIEAQPGTGEEWCLGKHGGTAGGFETEFGVSYLDNGGSKNIYIWHQPQGVAREGYEFAYRLMPGKKYAIIFTFTPGTNSYRAYIISELGVSRFVLSGSLSTGNANYNYKNVSLLARSRDDGGEGSYYCNNVVLHEAGFWNRIIAWDEAISYQPIFIGRDTGAAHKTTLANLLTVLSLSDSGSGSDSLSLLATLTQSDTGAGTDALASILAQIAASDVGSGADVQAITAAITAAETGAGADALSLLAAIAQSDSAVATDAIALLVAITATDTGAATDAISLLVQIAANDTGAGVEALNIAATLLLNDAGNATDLVSLLVTFALSDSGIGADAIEIINQLTVADTGIGTEALNIIAEILASDTGSASEAVALAVEVALQDTGLAADLANVLVNLNVADLGTGAEAIESVQTNFITLVDNGVLSNEAVAIINAFTLTDSGVGADIVNLVKRVYPYVKKASPYTPIN